MSVRLSVQLGSQKSLAEIPAFFGRPLLSLSLSLSRFVSSSNIYEVIQILSLWRIYPSLSRGLDTHNILSGPGKAEGRLDSTHQFIPFAFHLAPRFHLISFFFLSFCLAGLHRSEITAGEIADELDKERKYLQLTTADYLVRMNEIRTKKGVNLLQQMLEYYKSQLK